MNTAAVAKALRVKIFAPGNKSSRLLILKAPAGTAWTEQGIENQLKHLAGQIETAWPVHEFRLVPTGKANFNFVWDRERTASSDLSGEIR